MNKLDECNFNSYVDLMQDHRKQSLQMAKLLDDTHLFKDRADRMRQCSKLSVGKLCPKCHRFHPLNASLCRDRLCPNCGWALSHERASHAVRMLNAMSEAHVQCFVIHIVLTLQHNVYDDLSDVLDKLQDASTKFLQTKRIRSHMIGYMLSTEITYSEENGFHPHAHVLYFVDTDYFNEFIKYDEFVASWKRSLSADYEPLIWVQLAYSTDESGACVSCYDKQESPYQAIYEAVKYAIKPQEWMKLPLHKLYEAAVSIHYRQLFRIGGNKLLEFWRMTKPKNPVDADYVECPNCGTKTNKIAISFEEGAEPEVREL